MAQKLSIVEVTDNDNNCLCRGQLQQIATPGPERGKFSLVSFWPLLRDLPNRGTCGLVSSSRLLEGQTYG
jgi:hypothetical protein